MNIIIISICSIVSLIILSIVFAVIQNKTQKKLSNMEYLYNNAIIDLRIASTQLTMMDKVYKIKTAANDAVSRPVPTIELETELEIYDNPELTFHKKHSSEIEIFNPDWVKEDSEKFVILDKDASMGIIYKDTIEEIEIKEEGK